MATKILDERDGSFQEIESELDSKASLSDIVGKREEVGKVITIDGVEYITEQNAETFNDIEHNIVIGENAHAEGKATIAIGRHSHAEGYETKATGERSHAEGWGTVASSNQQHVQGKYNIEDTTSAEIVGNGTGLQAKSNAYTLDWDGNAWFSGDVYTGSTSGTNKDAGSKKLVSEEVTGDLSNLTTTDKTNLVNAVNELVDLKDNLCTSAQFADNKNSDILYPTCKAVYDNTANNVFEDYAIIKPFNWVDNQGGGTVQIHAIGHTDTGNNGYMNFFIYANGASKTFTDGHVICSDLPLQIYFHAGLIGIWHPVALCGSSGILETAYIVYDNNTNELILRMKDNVDNVTQIQSEFSVAAQFT